MNTSVTELKRENMERASGGTFWPNRYKKEEYAEAAITVADHFPEKDEFWWNGKNIGYDNANAVLSFCRKNGRAPVSLEEACRSAAKRSPKLNNGDLWNK